MATDLGIPLALTQLSCRHKDLDRRAVFAAMRRRAAVGSLAAVALVFAWANTNSGAHWGLAALYGISVTVTPITGCFLALLRGRAVGIIEACYEAGRQIALPALGIAAIQLGLGVWGVLGVYVTIDVIAAMLIAVLRCRRLGLSPIVDVDEESELRLRQTLPLSATGIVGNAYERVDSALLAPLAGLTAVGIYRMVTPIVGAVLMPAKAFGDTAAVAAGRTDAAGLPCDRRAFRDPSHHHHGAGCAPARDRRSDRAPARLAGARDGVEPTSDRLVQSLGAVAHPFADRRAERGGHAHARRAHREPAPDLPFRAGALAGNIAPNLLLVPSFGLDLGASGAALVFLTTEAILAVVLWSTLPGRLPAVAPSPRAVDGVGAIEPA